MRGGGERRLDVADLVEVVRGHVVRHVLVHRPVGPARVVDADDRRQHVVRHEHALGRVLGQVAVLATTITTASPTWLTSSRASG